MTLQQSLGLRVKYLRKKRGLTQLDLAYISGVNKNYISDLEKGKRNPTLSVLEKIADSLYVSLDELFKGVENIPGL